MTAVATLLTLPTRMEPLLSGASLLNAMAALVLMSAFTTTPAAIPTTPALLIVISPLTATAVGTLAALPTIMLPLVSATSLLSAMLPASIVLVTVPVSPVVMTVPLRSGSVIVRSAVVGSVAAMYVWNALVVAPSNANAPVGPISISPVMVPPARASFSLSSSVIAA